MLKLLLPLLSLAAFLWLAGYSQQEHGYSVAEVQALNNLASPDKPSKKAVIMEIWHITEAQASQPVNIFNEDEL